MAADAKKTITNNNSAAVS